MDFGPLFFVSHGIKSCGFHVMKPLKGLRDSISKGPRGKWVSSLGPTCLDLSKGCNEEFFKASFLSGGFLG